MAGIEQSQSNPRLHKIACLLGGSVSVLCVLGTSLGFATARWMGIRLSIGVMFGGLLGIFLSLGVVCVAASKVTGANRTTSEMLLSAELQPNTNVRVEGTVAENSPLGMSVGVKRSKRDGNCWLVITGVNAKGQAAQALPGIRAGMAIHSIQGQPVDLDNVEEALSERPLTIVCGDVEVNPASLETGTAVGLPAGEIAATSKNSSAESAPRPQKGDIRDEDSRFEHLPQLQAAPSSEMTSAEKIELIFAKFDNDTDAYLNMVETNRFMAATGAKEFTKKAWESVCSRVGADPSIGLDLAAFSKLESNVDDDFSAIFESSL